MIGQKKVVI